MNRSTRIALSTIAAICLAACGGLEDEEQPVTILIQPGPSGTPAPDLNTPDGGTYEGDIDGSTDGPDGGTDGPDGSTDGDVTEPDGGIEDVEDGGDVSDPDGGDADPDGGDVGDPDGGDVGDPDGGDADADDCYPADFHNVPLNGTQVDVSSCNIGGALNPGGQATGLIWNGGLFQNLEGLDVQVSGCINLNFGAAEDIGEVSVWAALSGQGCYPAPGCSGNGCFEDVDLIVAIGDHPTSWSAWESVTVTTDVMTEYVLDFGNVSAHWMTVCRGTGNSTHPDLIIDFVERHPAACSAPGDATP